MFADDVSNSKLELEYGGRRKVADRTATGHSAALTLEVVRHGVARLVSEQPDTPSLAVVERYAMALVDVDCALVCADGTPYALRDFVSAMKHETEAMLARATDSRAAAGAAGAVHAPVPLRLALHDDFVQLGTRRCGVSV